MQVPFARREVEVDRFLGRLLAIPPGLPLAAEVADDDEADEEAAGHNARHDQQDRELDLGELNIIQSGDPRTEDRVFGRRHS